MVERSDNVLWYERKPDGLKAFFAVNRRRMIEWGIVIILLMLGLDFLFGPHSGQIRLDTGDLRYCWFGIPFQYDRMPEPHRSKLLALASKSPSIPAKWVTCVTYPLPSSNNTDIMCRDFYELTAIWADEDPKIARWALEDIVDYIRDTHVQYGLPKSCAIFDVVDRIGRKVEADWRDQDEIKLYCAAHGYVPPPPATRP